VSKIVKTVFTLNKKLYTALILIIIFFFGETVMQSCSESIPITIKDDRFINFQKQIKVLTDPYKRQAAVDHFLTEVKKGKYPIFESDSTVVLLFQTDSDSAFVLGDMVNWSGYLPMEKIQQTNLYYFRGSYEPMARLEYWVSTDRDGLAGVDPLNPFKVLNGFGPMSELAMPKYERHPFFDDYIYGKKGETNLVEAVEIGAGILTYPHQLHVFLPPDYNKSEHDYPVVYFQDGIDYIEFALTPHVINELILSGSIEPLIAVFVTPPNRFQPGPPNRMTEYGLNDDYVSFITDELIPFIDRKYRTRPNPESRLVIGDSFGGLISAYIPFMRPDVFKLGYSQSGYLSFQNDKLINLYSETDSKQIRLYVDVGIYERAVGGAFLPHSETDFLMANRRFKALLRKKGYDFVYHEYFEGHTWGNWRRHLIDGLIHFFNIEKN
jgi:enterochelin esterase family protein